MKILYVTKELPFGSDEAFIYAELNQLALRGFEISIAPVLGGPIVHDDGRKWLNNTIAQPLASWSIFFDSLREFLRDPMRILKALFYTIDVSRPQLIPRNMAVWMKGIYLARIVRLRGIQHIHAHWIAVPSTMGMIAALITRVPFSITAHRYDIAQNNLVSRKFAVAKFVRAIDSAGVIELSAELRPGQKKPLLIRMGVEVPRSKAIRRPGALSTIRGVIGARFIPKKGHKVLFEAVAIAKRSGITVEIDCFGGGPLQAQLEDMILELNLKDSIRFKGVASHDALIDKMLHGSYDFAVLPSLAAADGDKEGVPVFLMEAMSVGLPVISTSNGGIPELLSDGAGLLVPEHDANAVSEALITLAQSEQVRLELSKAGRKRIEDDFNILKCASQIDELFRKYKFPVNLIEGEK